MQLYKPMLATSFDEDDPIHQHAFRTWDSEVKEDGMRCLLYLGENRAFSRVKSIKTDELTEKTEHIAWLKGLRAPYPMVLDGELRWGKNVRDTMKCLGSLPERALKMQEDEPVRFVAYDILLGREVYYMMSARVRSQRLHDAVYELKAEHVSLVQRRPLGLRNDGFLKLVVARGGEGIMLKNPYGVYVPGQRPPNTWVKVKPIRIFVATIMRVQPGKQGKTGQMVGLMGALELAMWNGKTLVPVGKTGTGFSLDQRAEKWSAREVVEVGCAEVTEDGKLSHSRFIRRRPDLNWKDTHHDQIASLVP